MLCLVGVVLWIGRDRPLLLTSSGGGRDAPPRRPAEEKDDRVARGRAARSGVAPEAAPSAAAPNAAVPGAAPPGAPVVDSDWDRFRLRAESEFLRVFRPRDRAALIRLTSRTLRGALEEIGIDRSRIDERSGAAAAAGTGRAPVQWVIEVPPRASLFRINDAVTQAIDILGGRVISGRELPAQTAGVALQLRVGYGDRATHAIVVEPNPEIADAGTRIAFVVLDIGRATEPLFQSIETSGIPFTVALRPDQPGVARASRALRAAGREIFLRLPMEPLGYPNVDPGKDAILLDLSRVEIEERINRCLSTVGSAQGVITRLGSAAVNDPDVIRAVLGEVKRRNLLFIDAHGAGPSLVEEVGEEIGARTIPLGGTLDGSGTTTAAVRARLKQLVQTAIQRGTLAVTFKASYLFLTVLEAERAKWIEQGIEVVPASRLVL